VHLASLQDRNEVLFFRLLHEHIDEMMPIVYTPVVGEACQRFSHIYRQSRGLYVGYDQRGRVADVLRNVPIQDAVGDRRHRRRTHPRPRRPGHRRHGHPDRQARLYTLCAGLPPDTTLPIMLDVGTDNPELLADPLYLGCGTPRVRGEAYQAFVDEFVAAVQRGVPDRGAAVGGLPQGERLHQLAALPPTSCARSTTTSRAPPR
jgi:hypothetical protein